MTSRDNQDPAKPRRPRRKQPVEADLSPETADEPKLPRRRAIKTVDKAEEPRRPPVVRKKRAASEKKKPAAKQKVAEAKAPPTGRIARALWLARLIIRLAPAWGFVLLLLLIFGPALLRSLRIATRSTNIAPLFAPEVQHWAPKIMQWSREYETDPNLIATLMQIESCGLPGAASSAGAQGLFQVMPFHFDPSENMTDPDTNARRGIGVIRDCLKWADNDVGLAMACYNGGPSLIYAPPEDWPAESQRYYIWGGGIFNDAQRGASKSETLDRWLASGGRGLCEQAAVALGISTPPLQSIPTAAPTTPVPILPTLAIVEPGHVPQVTPVDQVLPTFALPTTTPAVKLFLTPSLEAQTDAPDRR
jgi:soluble lytic murein transglycosylase-like protein